MDELTVRQKQIIGIIEKYLDRGDPFPTLEELAAELGINNRSGVIGHLRALERKGYVIRQEQRVSLYKLQKKFVEKNDSRVFALVGTIPAGVPAHSFDQNDRELIFDQAFFGGGDLKAVTISGESMSGDGIFDGDIAIIKLQKEFLPQDIVAVRVDDEVTLKRVQQNKDKVELIPSNPAFKIRRVPASSVDIVGKLVGVIRKT